MYHLIILLINNDYKVHNNYYLSKMNKKGFIGILILILIAIGVIVFFYFKQTLFKPTPISTSAPIKVSSPPSPTPVSVSPQPELPYTGKPVIYFYPTKSTDITVHLDYNGSITDTYPRIDKLTNNWKVKAFPNGTIINFDDNKEYSYIFWEGKLAANQFIDTTQGFIVPGDETQDFLQSKLKYLGLTPKEYNEFIVYWMPKMQHNKYNYIKFLGDEYTKNAKLTTTPEPDSILRVFMVYKALDEKIEVNPQVLTTFERKGFSMIEWGGSEISGGFEKYE